MKKTKVDLLIDVEIIVLVILLIVGLFTPWINDKEEGKTKENTSEFSQEETTKIVSDENTAAKTTVTDMSIQEALVFSNRVQKKLNKMTIKEKVAQMFITTPEQLTGVDTVTIAGEGTKKALGEYPVGGLIYSEKNFSDKEQMKELLQGTQNYGKEIIGEKLFLGVEEAGGEAASPVASAAGYDITSVPAEVMEDENALKKAASARGKYLKDIGFNMVLGPLADLADKSNANHDALTYGADALSVSERIPEEITEMQSLHIMCTVKSFPGEAAEQKDYSVYQAAIDTGVKCFMISNLTSQKLSEDKKEPASLSSEITQVLRNDMGYDGLLMTADLSEKSITNHYTIEDAAVKAVQSGKNMIYVTKHFPEAYEAVLNAVKNGTISENVLNNAVGRILEEKIKK